MLTVASPTVQEPEAITPKPEGGASVSKEEIPAEVEPLRINVGHTRWVYHCHVEGCTEELSSTLLPSNTMATGHIPLGPQTLSKVYFIYFIILPLLSYVIPMSK